MGKKASTMIKYTVVSQEKKRKKEGEAEEKEGLKNSVS